MNNEADGVEGRRKEKGTGDRNVGVKTDWRSEDGMDDGVRSGAEMDLVKMFVTTM